MPSIVADAPPPAPPALEKLRSTSDSVDQSAASGSAATRRSKSLARRGLGTAARNLQRKRRPKSGSISDAEFFEREAILVDDDTPPDAHAPQTMPTSPTTTLPARNGGTPVRMDTQDGPWSISVAEAPHDPSSYCLYVKTPTHNLTLTRSTTEILELDHKLRDNSPSVKLSPLPFDASVLRTLPKKKSNFLNTLSRFASPSKHASRASITASAAPTNALPTPANETTNDPFSGSFAASDIQTAMPAPTTLSTSLAAYLTTVSNHPQLKQARVWKRFVRVRTDDLESVRVERAIKHVRSDIAAHLGLVKSRQEEDKENATPHELQDASVITPPQTPPKDATPVKPEDIPLPDNDVDDVAADEAVKEAVENTAAIERTVEPVSEEPEAEPSTPQQTSASATVLGSSTSVGSESQVDKSVSRAVSYSTFQDGASSQAETGDESSVSVGTSERRRRKKRSMSKDPKFKKSQRKVVIDDFEMMRVLGKGCAGKVLLVRQKANQDLYALKAITKRHVLAHQELQHTLTEQAVLKRMAAESKDPFVIKLWWSFHDKENLFLVMDFHPGGDLATQLARWGRLGRDRARFYAAEIVEGVEGLHAAGVIYRDLKPENILIGGDGHIVLTDFGLSKEFPRVTSSSSAPSTSAGSTGGTHITGHIPPATPPWMKMDKSGELAAGWPGVPVGDDMTTTFCGTAEYLAPEVIQGQSYSYEIDWWSFGTMLYEMLTGITPFWANNHSDMYVRVLQDELHFPDDRTIDQDTKSLIRGLLQKNPGLRICEPRIKKHPYFSMIDWSHVYYKRYIPPYIPPIDPANAGDTQNFDETFLDMQPILDDPYENEGTDAESQGQSTDTDRTDGDGDESGANTPSQSRSSSVQPKAIPADAEDDSVDVFDGYSFKGRHSVLIDSDEDSEGDESSEEVTDEEDEGMSLTDSSAVAGPVDADDDDLDEEDEPKTPEARPSVLPVEETKPDVEAPPTPVEQTAAAVPPPPIAAKEPIRVSREHARVSKETHRPTEDVAPATPVKEEKTSVPIAKPGSKPAKGGKGRKERSGVPALDKHLDGEETGTERDEEDEDWDFIEADGAEDRNGKQATSLFARGVVDKYKLSVFRKASTTTGRPSLRTVSGMSTATADSLSEVPGSPTPSQRRGRSGGPLFSRKSPKPFAKASNKSTPPSSFSSRSALRSSQGTATPSTMVESPSLKSRGSRSAMSSLSDTGELSPNDGTAPSTPALSTQSRMTSPDGGKTKGGKKLKKYKEGAEKMLGSIFSSTSSPRPPNQQQP